MGYYSEVAIAMKKKTLMKWNRQYTAIYLTKICKN